MYCLTRNHSPLDAFDVVLGALKNRKLAVEETKLSKIVPLEAVLHQPTLGVDQDTLRQMRESVFLIIHAAWPVNFTLPLESFQPHIQGLYNLLQFSLSVHQTTPAVTLFLSSVSTALGTRSVSVPETPLEDLHSALDMGYARSKFVGEHMISHARGHGARAYSLRIGQVSGHSQKGLWNDNEAIPLMVRSAFDSGVIPELKMDCCWVPVDTLATVILQIADRCVSHTRTSPNQGGPSHAEGDDGSVYNLCNPHRFPWSTFLDILEQEGIHFRRIGFAEWIENLRQHRLSEPENPAVPLTDYYQAMHDQGAWDSSKRFVMEKTSRESLSLEGSIDLVEKGIIRAYARDWVRRWSPKKD